MNLPSRSLLVETPSLTVGLLPPHLPLNLFHIIRLHLLGATASFFEQRFVVN
jgi:hypothetical protein